MSEKVKGILIADCYVGKKLCKAGEEVEVSAELAEAFFGKVEKTEKPKTEKAKE
jgi:hypothetical protein